jgi:large subunit ribosomal protein L28
MSRVCDICGKRPVAGNAVSHSGRKTRRLRVPNIKRVRAMVNGRRRWLHVCTRCIKSGRVTKAA